MLTKELKSFILEIREELVEAIDKVEKQLNAGSPWADEIDEYKLKTFLGEVDKNLNEIEKNGRQYPIDVFDCDIVPDPGFQTKFK